MIGIYSGDIDNGTVLNERMYVLDGGIANNTSIDSDGLLYVSSGGMANYADVFFQSTIELGYTGGYLFVMSGGSANHVTVNESGYLGILKTGVVTHIIENGGYVGYEGREDGEDIVVDPNVISRVRLYHHDASVHSGTTAFGMIFDEFGELYVFSGGIAIDNYVCYDHGERLYVYSGGLASSNTVAGNNLQIYSGGLVKDTEVWYGMFRLSDGCVASNTSLCYSGYMTVSSGGMADSVTVSSTCSLIVSDGGTVNNLDIKRLGSLTIASGGRLEGSMAFERGAVVSAEAGAVLDFDIRNAHADGQALVKELAILRGVPDYTLTVNDSQQSGVYTLANGLKQFDQAISVFSSSGDKLGTLALDTPVEISGSTYTLFLSLGRLSLAVGCAPPEIAGVSSNAVLTDTNNTVYVHNGETFFCPYISRNCRLSVLDGGTVISAYLEPGATITPYPAGATLAVSRGGAAYNTVVDIYCLFAIHSGGYAESITVNGRGTLSLIGNGIAKDITNQGDIIISSGGIVDNTLNYAQIYILSGGTARDTFNSGTVMDVYGTAVNTWNRSNMCVYSGGVANSTTDLSFLGVESGGTAINTNVISGGLLTVESGGFADCTTLNSRGTLIVSSGGTATGIVEHGGFVDVQDGANVAFVSHAISRLFLSNTSATVHSCTTVTDVGISSGSMIIFSGGVVNSITLSSGGSLFVSGGVANSVTIQYGGKMTIGSGGKLTGQVISFDNCISADPGAIMNFDLTQMSPGTAPAVNNLAAFSGTPLYTITVNAADQAEGVYQLAGRAASLDQTITVMNTAGDDLGSLALGETVTIDGISYRLFLSEDILSLEIGEPITSDPFDGPILSSGTATVQPGEICHDMLVTSGACLILAADVMVDGITVDSGCLLVSSGGIANGTTVSQGCMLLAGGTANNADINSQGYLYVCEGVIHSAVIHADGFADIISGSIASNTTVIGSFFVSSGCLADRTTVSSGGFLSVDPEGKADHTTVLSGGRMCVSSGGTADHTTVSFGGRMTLSSGTADNTTVLSGGSMCVSSGGTAENATVSSGGSMSVFREGAAGNTTVAGGFLEVFCDAAAPDTIVGLDGTLAILSGGTAELVVENGGYVEFAEGAVVTFANNSFSGLVLSNASATVHSGTTAVDLTLREGGSLLVSSNGIASQIVENGGYVEIADGAVVTFADNAFSGLVLSNASATVHSGTTASDLLINEGGCMAVFSGGTAVDAEISGNGALVLFSGGTAIGTVVNSNCGLIVSSGGTANIITVSSGGVLFADSGANCLNASIQSGGCMDGWFNCEEVSFLSGAILNADVSGLAPGNAEAPVKGLSSLSGIPVLYTLSVADSQETGIYKIAENASGFDSAISVFNSDVQLCTLRPGQTAEADGRSYKLDLSGNDLVLQVDPFQYVYLDFNGEDNTRYSNPVLNLSLPVTVRDPGYSEEQKAEIVLALTEQYGSEGVVFTLDRPENVEYSTLFFGQSDAFNGYTDCWGIAETHDFNNSNKNDNAYVLLDQSYSADQIASVASHMLDHLLGYSVLADESLGINRYAETKVLLSTLWNQEDPYNKYCPIDPLTNQRCVTGCTNTAAAQNINYWIERGLLDFSLSLDASDAYTRNGIVIDDSDDPVSGHLSFAEINKLLADYKVGDEDCIAALSFVAGVVQKADYGLDGTSTGWRASLFTRSGFKTPFHLKFGNSSSPFQYDSIVQELLQGRPVEASIVHSPSCHDIVIDGYDSSTNSFHLNYGWGVAPATRWYTMDELGSWFDFLEFHYVVPVLSPDLVLMDLSVETDQVYFDDDITLSFTVSNEGRERSETTTAYVYCGEVLIKKLQLTYVSPGSSRDLTCTFNAASLPVGENVITVKLDSQNSSNSWSIASLPIMHSSKKGIPRPTVSADITTVTNSDVLVTASFSQLASIREYSFDRENWLPYAEAVRVVENGTVYFRGGNDDGVFSSVADFTVGNIDKVAPVITLTGDNQSSVKQSTLAAQADDGSEIFYSADNQTWTKYEGQIEVTENGTYFFKATDAAGNTGTATIVFSNILPAAPDNLSGTKEKVSWEPIVAEQYVVEYSTDNFEHVIRTVTSGTAIDLLDLPAGTYQWRVRTEDGEEWAVGEELVSDNEAGKAKVVRSNEDGVDDIFFATPNGTWETLYYARHDGSVNDWAGTGDLAAARGKGKIRNLFFGSADPNVLCLTDADNGDVLFIDDVYTELPEEAGENTSRLYKIKEIRAGAGNDIVDMTSQRFEYTGDGLTIRGGDGNDTIWANKGDNFLFGDTGKDRIVGASGNDVIAGGIGNDRMHGGGGNDVFMFCGNWGADTVEQLASGTVTLWFASGSMENWNAETLTYTDGANSVTVSGVTADQITLKFGDDGSAQFAALSDMGAFDAFTSRKIFEESGKGILASL